MADQHVQARLVSRNDTAENWTAQNPILLQGEMGVETDTGKFKFGDGSTPWGTLPYFSVKAMDMPLEPVEGMSAATVQEGIAENFQSVVDGKSVIEAAVNDKGGVVSKDGNTATFLELAEGVLSIATGSGNECSLLFENYDPLKGAVEKQIWEPLSQARKSLVGIAVGNKAVFAGGTVGSSRSPTVDVYTMDGKKAVFSSLSQARTNLASACTGIHAVFAGGYTSSSYSAVVDAFTEEGEKPLFPSLPQACNFLAGASTGNKAVFAGGSGNGCYNSVTAYTETGTRLTFPVLSVARADLAGVGFKGRAVFAGGQAASGGKNNYYANLDVYAEDGTKSSFPSLSRVKGFLSGGVAGNAVIFAGGLSVGAYIATVDAFTEDGVRTIFPDLTFARYNLSASTTGVKALFAGGSAGYMSNYYAIVDAFTDEGVKSALPNLSQAKEYCASAALAKKAIFCGGSLSASSHSANTEIYAAPNMLSLSIINGGCYDFGEGEQVTEGSLLDPAVTNISVKLPVNGYIKYKGEYFNG